MVDVDTDGYDANKSQIVKAALADFMEASLDEDITTVPGIGNAAAKHLRAGVDGS